MDTTFILEYLDQDINPGLGLRFLSKIIKVFNPGNPYLKLKFKNDDLNRYFGIKYSLDYNSYEDSLKGGMISIPQAMNIFHLLDSILLRNIPGDVVELGSYEGVTAMILQNILKGHDSEKRLHVFDSFQGLPNISDKDGITKYKKGMCRAEKSDLINNFKHAGLDIPEIHEGWFEDTLPNGLPDKIAFAHLDGDLHSSTLTGLRYLYPKLSRGAVLVIDDYCDPARIPLEDILPGVKRACDEFLADKPEKVEILLAGIEPHGYLTKQ